MLRLGRGMGGLGELFLFAKFQMTSCSMLTYLQGWYRRQALDRWCHECGLGLLECCRLVVADLGRGDREGNDRQER